jgi:hypothetical protein
MKARLQEVHTVVADEINQSILACDATRPDIRAHLLEVLGLSDAGKGIPHHSLDQIKYSQRCLPVRINPPAQIVDALWFDHQGPRSAWGAAPVAWRGHSKPRVLFLSIQAQLRAQVLERD